MASKGTVICLFEWTNWAGQNDIGLTNFMSLRRNYQFVSLSETLEKLFVGVK